jgi:hypothetical protein
MTTRTTRRAGRLAALGFALGVSSSTGWAQTQSWNYKSYLRDKTTGQYSKENFRTSTITLTEKDGKAVFRMLTAGRDICHSASDMPAEVERTPELTIIVVTPTVSGCEPFRYEIRNDGSGGVRKNRKGERWVGDGLDHDLTPAK